MDNQSKTTDTPDTFELGLITRRITGPRFEPLFLRVATIVNSSIAVYLWDKKLEEEKIIWTHKKRPICENFIVTPWAVKKCFNSRVKITRQVANLDIPILYKCHVGFYCASVCLYSFGNTFVIMTVGPFCIDGGEEVIKSEFIQNVKKLNGNFVDEDSIFLNELPRLVPGAMKEVLLWARDTFQKEWADLFITGEDGYRNKKSLDNLKIGVENNSWIHSEKLESIRVKMFLIALQIQNKKLAELVLRSKGEEMFREGKDVSKILFLLYVWSINIITTKLADYARDKIFNEELLLSVKGKIFQDSKTLIKGIKIICKIIFSSLDRKHINSTFPSFDKKKQRFKNLLSVLENNLWLNNSLGQISNEFGVTASALSHWLKRNFDISYEELLIYMQVEKAGGLLRKTKKGLSRIAKEVGMKYSSHLSLKFKEMTGYSPSEYRILFSEKR